MRPFLVITQGNRDIKSNRLSKNKMKLKGKELLSIGKKTILEMSPILKFLIFLVLIKEANLWFLMTPITSAKST
jgi:hypothetical protein